MDAAGALRFLQRMARNGKAGFSQKALHELHATYGVGVDNASVWDAVCAATAAHVHKVGLDHGDPSRTVIVLRLPFAGGTASMKASLRRNPAESAYLLSCKRWER